MTVNYKDNIYKLNLHETIVIEKTGEIAHPTLSITRVASGWLYCYSNSNVVFVPFDNTFMGNER